MASVIMDIFENFIRLFSGERISNKNQSKPLEKSKESGKSKYDDDVKALQDKYGDLNGKEITVQLQELLDVVPRERRRIEAFSGLRTYLKNTYGCVLNISSRKTKI